MIRCMLTKASIRIGSDTHLSSSDDFVLFARRAPHDFTRRRKMPIEKLVASILARKGRSLKLDLRELGKEEGMEKISVPGYLKQREKLNPQALLLLACHHASQIYEQEEVSTYKDHLLLAIDASSISIPTTPETLEIYGNGSSNGRDQALCSISCIFDSLNRQLINTTINRRYFDEGSQLEEHLEVAEHVIGDRPFILVMDRAYFSLARITSLNDAGVPYVIRCQSNQLVKEFKEAASAGGDKEIPVELTNKRLERIKKEDPATYKNLKEHEPTLTRCVLLDIGKDADERIVTNLPVESFSSEDIKEIYHLRWNIETCFGMLKDKLQMENFTGTKPILIEQDIYASTYLLNVAYDLANEAEEDLKEKQGQYKHTMTINKSFAIGVLKDEFLKIMLSPPEKRHELMQGIGEELKENLVPVRENRSYARPGQHRRGKYSTTHKRVF